MAHQTDWLDLLKRYGLGTVLALAFAWFLMNGVTTSQASALKKLDDLSRALTAHESQMRLDTQRNVLIQRQICVNTAKDEGQRVGCIEAAR